MKAPSLHPSLLGEPSLATQTNRAIHMVAEEVNLLLELLDLLKGGTQLRPCDKYGEQYTPDQHVRYISERRYADAMRLMRTRGALREHT